MDPSIHSALSAWNNFYLITGAAAASLTGLQFVVQTLLASDGLRPVMTGDTEGGIAAFGTPTVVHFSVAMVISAILCAPWPGYDSLRVVLGVIGVATLIYSMIVLGRARRQQSYDTTRYDWIFHVLLPAAAYTSILLAAIFFERAATASLYAVAAATLLLVCVGIHNAWDTVTYLLISALRAPAAGGEHTPKSSARNTHKPRR